LAAWSIRAPFFVYAGTLVVAGTVAMIGLRRASLARAPDHADAGQPSRTSLTAALRERTYRAALVANLADSWAAMGVRNTLVPLFVVESLHRGTAWVGIGFTVVAAFNAGTLIPAGRLVDSHGRRPIIVAGCLLSGSSMALLAIAPNIAGYLVAMVIFGIGSGLLDVAPAAVVGDVAGKRGGTVVAAFQMAGDGGSVSGPVVAGWVADTWSYGAAFWVTTGILAGAATLAARAPDIKSGDPASVPDRPAGRRRFRYRPTIEPGPTALPADSRPR
jgi:MFS family permease